MNNIRAQLECTAVSVWETIPTSGPIQYAFVERVRIAKAFCNLLSTFGTVGDVDGRVSIVDGLVSLCTRQDKRFGTARQK